MSYIIEETQTRYQTVGLLTFVPFNALAQPIFIEEDDPFQLLRIYILDENAGKITEVREGETVGEALQRISTREKDDARFVLSLELSQIALVPHNPTE